MIPKAIEMILQPVLICSPARSNDVMVDRRFDPKNWILSFAAAQ